MPERYLVTSALPYANGPLHVGQLAGAYMPADSYVRYLRLAGKDVIYICGSDEHGVPITVRAEKEGVTPQQLVDRYHAGLAKTFDALHFTFDNYSRTTLREIHYPLSQRFFTNLYEGGCVKPLETEQLFCENCNRFLPDRYVEGTCPHCGTGGARGDQCENCGRWLAAMELGEPRCKVCDGVPVVRKTTHWYLELPKFADRLREWLAGNTHWRDNVRKFCLSWLDEGLADRAITRDINWGVPVPLPEARGKVLYVWFDAPIGYITSTIEWARKLGRPDRWKDYWLDADTKLVHFIGKDNIVFHALVWPAMLMGQPDGFTLPFQVPANEFLNLEGRKISTSRNWAVWVDDALADFQVDALRYYLTANAPETRDADFSFAEMATRVNSELADIFGNFVNRALAFVKNYLGNEVPRAGALQAADEELLKLAGRQLDAEAAHVENFEMRAALAAALEIARAANKYYNDEEPWAWRERDRGRAETILNVSCRVAAALSTAFDPFTPVAAAEIRRMLGMERALSWEEAKAAAVAEGAPLGDVKILIEKIDEGKVAAQLRALEKSAGLEPEAAVPEEKKETVPTEEDMSEEHVNMDDVKKLGMVVAEVKTCERVEGADKLFKMTVDVGGEERPVVAGIAPWYEPEDLVGKKIIVVKNMQPATIRGAESRGMLLAAEHHDVVKVLALDGDLPAGAKVL
ncbi:MAG: methionine--tRNA ligase [bacterium]